MDSLNPSQLNNERNGNPAEKSSMEQNAAARLSTNQAFTLACTGGFVPAALVVLLAFMITRSWLTVVITGVVMAVVLLAFSNLVAYNARRKALTRKRK
jgi:ABC-type Fe3+-siderophore transport system permease subunit